MLLQERLKVWTPYQLPRWSRLTCLWQHGRCNAVRILTMCLWDDETSSQNNQSAQGGIEKERKQTDKQKPKKTQTTTKATHLLQTTFSDQGPEKIDSSFLTLAIKNLGISQSYPVSLYRFCREAEPESSCQRTFPICLGCWCEDRMYCLMEVPLPTENEKPEWSF